MSLAPNIAFAAAVAATGFAAGGTALTLTGPTPAAFVAPVPSGTATDAPAESARLSHIWPAIFGTEVIPEPEPQPEPEPVAVADPPPDPDPEPEIRYDYALTGIVADRYDGWALLSLGGLQQIVKVGDELEGGEVVTAIDHAGVHIEWRGLPQLIPVNRADTSAMARDLAAEKAETPPARQEEVSVVMERMDRRFLQETFEAAGNLVLTDLADGTTGLNVVWIRQGELYDRIGLRLDDKILRINGSMVESPDVLAYLPDAITEGGTIDLEILRDGTRQIIKVNLGQG